MLKMRFVTIPVKNQDRALRFYRDQLGCSVVSDRPYGGGQRWIEVSWPGGGSHAVLFTTPGNEGRIGTFTGISMMAEDIEATYHQLVDRGVTFLEPLSRADWGGWQAIFQDVDGNSFVLAEE